MKRPLLLLALLLPWSLAQASAEWYAVEVVVFSRSGTPGPGGTLLPPLNRAVDPAPPSAIPAPFARLPDSALALLAQARRLQAGGSYRVLVHTGWWQRLSGPGGLQAARLDSAARDMTLGETLTGTVGVYRTQVINVRLDLAMVTANALPGNGAVLRLKETRGVRPNEINYFDHPDLGVLVQVRAAP